MITVYVPGIISLSYSKTVSNLCSYPHLQFLIHTVQRISCEYDLHVVIMFVCLVPNYFMADMLEPKSTSSFILKEIILEF